MVPQPTRTLDLDRKEELIIQKQIRQSTTRMMKQNLPTLIEASPDFNQKKLPYLPNIPASVQIGNRPNTDTWFDQYQDSAESVTTDDIPSLYSVPQKRRNPHKSPSHYDINCDIRPDSRISRSASITFDLDDDIHKGNRINSKKRPKEKKETQANISAKEESDTIQRSKNTKQELHIFQDQDQELSMWACRKCTLDNPLQEATCLACGGSRLSSIGDIEVQKMMEPDSIVDIIVGEDKYPTETRIHDETEKDVKWKCIVCTFENDPLAYYCDACNSQSPHKMKIELKPEKKKIDLDFKDLSSNFARYFGIACFLAIIIYSLINMIVCLYSTMQTIMGFVPENKVSVEYKTFIEIITEQQEDKIEDAKNKIEYAEHIFDIEQVFSYEIFGVKPVMMAIFCPVFFYLATKFCKKIKLCPRVPQPM